MHLGHGIYGSNRNECVFEYKNMIFTHIGVVAGNLMFSHLFFKFVNIRCEMSKIKIAMFIWQTFFAYKNTHLHAKLRKCEKSIILYAKNKSDFNVFTFCGRRRFSYYYMQKTWFILNANLQRICILHFAFKF